MARIGVVVFLLGLAESGCQRTPFADGLPSAVDCSGCHGQKGDPTPPPAVNGSTSTDTIAVGAHLAHMRGSSLAGPVACSECHILPLAADGTEHPDPLGRSASVDFGFLATQAPAKPVWNRDTRTCAGTYCHGVTLRGGDKRPAPIWTRVDDSQVKCDSCHGYPPADTHPQIEQCEQCHAEVVSANGVIKNPLLHIDGLVQIN